MRQKTSFAQLSRTLILSSSIFFAAILSARAQTVIPTVCIVPNNRSGTTTLTTAASAGQPFFQVDTSVASLPQHLRAVINSGGATEETVIWAYNSNSSNIYGARNAGGSGVSLTYTHNAGETVQWFTDAAAVWGYNNTSSANVSIPKGIVAGNYFFPGPGTYSEQPNMFLPGIHTAFSFDFPSRDVTINWALSNGLATASKNAPVCAQITYQGRLTDGGSAANGSYDLQFTAYDQLTGGTAQSEAVVIEDATVTNGIFTVPLNFGSAFYNNGKARYLEISVRPGTSTGAFTALAPRQPITTVPYAVNAQTAVNAANATNASNAASATTAQNVIGGSYVVIPLTTNAPPANQCDQDNEHGNMKVDAVNGRLYVCTVAGWKYTTLQQQ